jgi:hypothetical protein
MHLEPQLVVLQGDKQDEGDHRRTDIVTYKAPAGLTIATAAYGSASWQLDSFASLLQFAVMCLCVTTQGH